MKKLMMVCALILSSPLANAAGACMKNIKAVEENEKKNTACKASYLKNLHQKYGNKTLNGPFGAQVKFLDMSKEMAVIYGGEKYTGAVCCDDGKWTLQNSLGVKSLSSYAEGIKIDGYRFEPTKISSSYGSSSREARR